MPKQAATGRIELKATQQRVLAELKDDGVTRLTRGQYEQIAGVSRSQAAYDLAELVEAGILERVGGGRSTSYRLARPERPGQRRWTSERIRAALEEFCNGRETWPSAKEFKAAGHSDLYVAASRYGGIAFWTAELGFARPGRAAPPATARPRWRPRLSWAAAAAVLAAVLFAAGGASFYVWHGGTAHRAAPARAPQTAASREQASRRESAQSRRATPKTQSAHHAALRRSAVVSSAPSSGAQLVTQTVSSPAHSTASAPRTAATQPSRPSGGPAPLAAPHRTGGFPPPLPPPSG